MNPRRSFIRHHVLVAAHEAELRGARAHSVIVALSILALLVLGYLLCSGSVR